jgi:hypothetical protein
MSFIPMGKTRTQDFKCEDCSQLIYQNLNRNLPKFMHVMNAVSGKGGLKGNDHICPFKQDGALRLRMKKTLKCDRCLQYFSGVFRSCPNCFKRRCQGCRHVFKARYDTNCFCPHCQSPYSEGVFTTWLVEGADKYVPCQPVLNPVG